MLIAVAIAAWVVILAGSVALCALAALGDAHDASSRREAAPKRVERLVA